MVWHSWCCECHHAYPHSVAAASCIAAVHPAQYPEQYVQHLQYKPYCYEAAPGDVQYYDNLAHVFIHLPTGLEYAFKLTPLLVASGCCNTSEWQFQVSVCVPVVLPSIVW